MATLKEICKMEVIKLGAPREELPKTILKEVEIMEEKMKTFFTGSFSNICNSSYSSLKIDLVDGEWHFTVCAQPTLKIRGGGSNSLGLPGGQLFLFPGRRLQLMISRLICWKRRSSSTEHALRPRILQGENSSLVYFFLQTPSLSLF